MREERNADKMRAREWKKNKAYGVHNVILSSGRLRRCGASVLCGFPAIYTHVGLSLIIRTESRNSNSISINFSYRSMEKRGRFLRQLRYIYFL